MRGPCAGMLPPRVLTGGVLIEEDIARRMRAVCSRVGYRRSVPVLGLGRETIDEARSGGRVQPATRVRIIEALERVERELAQQVAAS